MTTDQNGNTERIRTPRKGPGRPAAGEALTPQEIAQAALRLILSDGEGALTMRRLGEVLGVKAMALYNHFADKEAILDAVASLALTRVKAPPTKGPWKSRVKGLCHEIRALALAEPALFRVAMTRPSPPSGALPKVESVLAALADAGLAPPAQAVAYQTLRLYVRAYCLWEMEESRLTKEQAAEFARQMAAYPHVAATIEPIFAPDADRQFEAGLDIILRGLQSGKDR